MTGILLIQCFCEIEFNHEIQTNQNNSNINHLKEPFSSPMDLKPFNFIYQSI